MNWLTAISILIIGILVGAALMKQRMYLSNEIEIKDVKK